jgi:hypothetical protein
VSYGSNFSFILRTKSIKRLEAGIAFQEQVTFELGIKDCRKCWDNATEMRLTCVQRMEEATV